MAHLNEINRDQRRKLTTEAPTGFLPRHWAKYVTAHDKGEPPKVARPYYELALLTTLNERLESGDVIVTHSPRWTDCEDFLIPRVTWAKEREQHYAKLGLPLPSRSSSNRGCRARNWWMSSSIWTTESTSCATSLTTARANRAFPALRADATAWPR